MGTPADNNDGVAETVEEQAAEETKKHSIKMDIIVTESKGGLDFGEVIPSQESLLAFLEKIAPEANTEGLSAEFSETDDEFSIKISFSGKYSMEDFDAETLEKIKSVKALAKCMIENPALAEMLAEKHKTG